GFRFPDGTLQTTATTGGGAGDGHSLDAADGSPVDALFVDNDGNVGIGTDNPNTELDVNGLITTDALFFNSHSPGNQINLEGVGIPRAASINWDLGTAGGLIQILGVETDNTPGSQDTELRFITAKDNQINTGMIINSTGYVGIGTRDPQVKLSLGTDINPKKLALWDGVNDFYGLGVQPGRITIYTQDTEKMTIKDNGNVGIGTINPQHRLDVNGDIGSGGTVYHSSDIRWKKNIQQVTNALSKVTNLRGVEFEWRRDEFKEKNFTNGRKLGFIAQEVEKIAPEVVSTDNDGYKSVAYANVTALLVEAIKTQQATIDALVERITTLERRQGITSR
ncbi:MAG: tail fiber domain-containing protein, partial [bacterium]